MIISISASAADSSSEPTDPLVSTHACTSGVTERLAGSTGRPLP